MNQTIETKATLRRLRMSPRKVRFVVDDIRGKRAVDAVAVLKRSQKHAARPVLKLIQSAMANARHNHNMDEQSLVVKFAYVDGGAIMYRWMPRAFGRATPLRKRTSHVTVVLEGAAPEVKKSKKQETKKTDNQESGSAAEKNPSAKAQDKKEDKPKEASKKKATKKAEKK